ERRGVRLNAHMADEIARHTRGGQLSVGEAIDEVLAHPEKYHYKRPPTQSTDELVQDTWSAYRQLHQDMSALAYKLKPEVAAMFSPPQKRDLRERLSSLLASL